MKVSLVFEGMIDGKQQVVTKTGNIADALWPYFLANYRQTYGKAPDTNADGTPKLDANKQPVLRDRTDEEVIAAYCAGIDHGTTANVQSFVREQAHKAADAAIPTIAVT